MPPRHQSHRLHRGESAPTNLVRSRTGPTDPTDPTDPRVWRGRGVEFGFHLLTAPPSCLPLSNRTACMTRAAVT